MKNNKKQIIWSLIFIALIVLTVWVIVKQNESFSIEGFINYVSAAKWQWIALAFLCMVGFIVFEGLAVLQLCKAFGYKEKVKRGIVYSAVDIYFSAITPSATGGQPASAMCMMQDGIPGAVTTIVLLLNLTLYTIAIIVIGAVCFIFNFFARNKPISTTKTPPIISITTCCFINTVDAKTKIADTNINIFIAVPCFSHLITPLNNIQLSRQ